MKHYTQRGIAQILVLAIFVIGGTTAIFTSVTIQNNKKKQIAATALATAKPKALATTTTTAPSSEATAQPASTPASTTSTTPSVKKTTSSVDTTTVSSPPAPVEVLPTYLGSITISDDGCTVTANAPAGMSLLVQTYSTNKGGQMSYTIPESGTITKYSGGSKGMTVDAQLYTSSNSKDAHAVGTITQDLCGPAG